MPKRFTWSYSAYSIFFKCRRWYRYKKIDKLPEPSFYASDRGILIHKKAEHVIKGDIIGIPKELRCFGNELKDLRRMKAETEVDLSFTEDWGHSHGKDWDNVWCRVYSDVVSPEIEAVKIVDHKTGKIYEEDIIKQAEINALGAFCHYDNVKKVNVEFWYYDLDDTRNFEFNSFTSLKRKWTKRVREMESEKKFAPCPGYYCAWCNFSKKKGGPCDEA